MGVLIKLCPAAHKLLVLQMGFVELYPRHVGDWVVRSGEVWAYISGWILEAREAPKVRRRMHVRQWM
jgi:hypothetical protein